ncbi:hypothetical protein JTE90_022682 [Oedothorax gibbosus]|uniref:TTF-type domain-containing protein n=1 Tax=Oedothorax gibbosus TaxID=931172 RepID=A0AAV6UKE4_9ARAC|nr:hypothetical protein JTE90_022682 [Oedothorax gibbosus]
MVNEILDENPESFGNPMNAEKIVNDREKAYIRHFPENNFFILKADGTKEKREWHFYSETSDSAFCYVCKMFSKTGSQFSTRGCSDWKNISRRICEHKRSLDHRQSMFDFSKRSQQKGLIDTELIKQFENERQYWRHILKRVVATVKFLSSLGLAFRGNNESEGEGNYFSCLKYLAEFDPFLASHIKRYANHGQGSSTLREAEGAADPQPTWRIGQDHQEFDEGICWKYMGDANDPALREAEQQRLLQFVDRKSLRLDSPSVKQRVLKILNLRGGSIKTIRNVMREFAGNMGCQ